MAHIAERIADAILAERLVDDTGTADDEAYNRAIDDALTAARSIATEPDPLRELAEWLVSKDWTLPALNDRSDAAAVLLTDAITRARKALDRTEEG